MITRPTLFSVGIAFIVGFIAAWTAQNWRGAAQIAQHRAQYQQSRIIAQNAQNQALKTSSTTSAIIADFFGGKDHETAQRIGVLLARNAVLVRDAAAAELRNQPNADGGSTRCLPNASPVANHSPATSSATGMSADLSGRVGQASEDLTRIYALEADILRAKLDACVADYEKARFESNKMATPHN